MIRAGQNMIGLRFFKYPEMRAVFELTKSTYLGLLTSQADLIWRQYATLLFQLKHNTSQSQHPQLYHALVEMQGRYQASIESIPSILRDIFELFIETHNSKNFIRKHQLLDGP